MTIKYARYVRPELVLADLTATAEALAKILKAEARGVRDGDGTWHGSDALHAALHELGPQVAELAALYVDATEPAPFQF